MIGKIRWIKLTAVRLALIKYELNTVTSQQQTLQLNISGKLNQQKLSWHLLFF